MRDVLVVGIGYVRALAAERLVGNSTKLFDLAGLSCGASGRIFFLPNDSTHAHVTATRSIHTTAWLIHSPETTVLNAVYYSVYFPTGTELVQLL